VDQEESKLKPEKLLLIEFLKKDHMSLYLLQDSILVEELSIYQQEFQELVQDNFQLALLV